MKLTSSNAKYDASSGAFIVQQSDEIKMLLQITKQLDRLEAKIDAIGARGRTDGTDMGEQ